MPQLITPQEAAEKLRQGATLVDIREPNEYARVRIPGAINLPLSRLQDADLAPDRKRPILFHCRSGARTRINADQLAAKAGDREAFVVAGGLNAWRRAGLPVTEEPRPMPGLAQQVRIAAGTIIALGILFGITVSPWFYMAAAMVGWGVVMPDACWLMPILRRMPWNKVAA